MVPPPKILEERVICGFESTGLPRHALSAPAGSLYVWRCCDSRDCSYKVVKEELQKQYCTYERGGKR